MLLKKILFALAALFSLAACNNNEPAATTDGKAIVENIMTRTSIRNYTEQTISADTIETLLRAGMSAPTAVNKQPWRFRLLTSEEERRKIQTCYQRERFTTAPMPQFSCSSDGS